MTVVARLEAILRADTSQFVHEMDKAGSKMKKSGQLAGAAGLAIAGGLAIGLDKSVKSAMAAQVSQSRLEQAFKAAGLNAAIYEKRIQTVEVSSRKMGFTNEDVRSSLGSLITATGNYATAQKRLAVAEDLARYKHVSLEAATKALTMASAGSTRFLKQLGILTPTVTSAMDALKIAHDKLTPAQKKATEAAFKQAESVAKLKDKQDTIAKAMEIVTQKVHGQADAFSQTAAGSVEKFHAEIENLQVTLGTALLPILAKVATTLANVTAYFSKHATETKILVAATAVLAGALIAASVAQHLMNLAVLANPYVAAAVAIVALGVAIYIFRDKIMNVFNWIKDHWVLLTAILTGPIGLAVAEIISHKDTLVRIFTNLPGDIAKAFTAGIGAVKDAITGLFGKVIGWVKDVLGIASPSAVFHKIGQQSIQGFVNGVGSMAGILKHAVTNIVGDVAGSLYHGAGSLLHGGAASGSQNNRSIGQAMAAQYGWGKGAEWANLDALWNQESGWSNTAMNQSSGAFGIPQALPYTKMPKAAWPTSAGGQASAVAQIKWGLDYIKSRYGSPIAAEAHERAFNWYDRGGWLPTGLSLAMNNTGRPERVLPPGGGGDTVIVQVGAEEVARVVFDQIRGKAQVFQRRNGRPAFGGA